MAEDQQPGPRGEGGDQGGVAGLGTSGRSTNPHLGVVACSV